MMDGFETIITRRSIRKYKKQPIPPELIQKLFEAASQAPSAGNQQPWQFILLDDHTILNVIPTFHPNAKMLTGAEKAIVICGDLDKEKFKGYWMIDCAAATQNMLLAAHSLGLGACWLGLYPRKNRITAMKKLFHLPSHIIPFAIVSLGYAAEEKTIEHRYDPTRVHHNKW
jgi:nitroreductase